VADGSVAWQGGEGRVSAALANQAGSTPDGRATPVRGYDAPPLLAAVLQRVQADANEPRRLGVVDDAEDCTDGAPQIRMSICFMWSRSSRLCENCSSKKSWTAMPSSPPSVWASCMRVK